MAKFDVAILGGGSGGYATALRAARLGLSVALVEQDKVGGTCLHIGCIPTKALLHSAEVFETVGSAGDFGIVAGAPSTDWAGVLGYKDGVVGRHFKGLQGLIKAAGITVVNGRGRLKDASRIAVEGFEDVAAASVVLATGSEARSLPFIEIDGRAFITSDHALSLEGIPGSVIVIGAGAVGLEFASIYRSFGSQVTVLEALPRLAPGEDEEISAELSRQFRKAGIEAHAGVKVTAAAVAQGRAEVVFESGQGEQKLRADKCLVAVGRGPRSAGLGFEEAGVRVEKGYVVCDGDCRTSVDAVWALGDLIAQPSLGLPFPHFQLAHLAFAEGIHVAEQIAGVETAPINYPGVPRATYSTPEIASVGLTEAQAAAAGHAVKTSKFNWAASSKASILGQHGGFVKVVAEQGGAVLGVHMIGPRVTEIVSEAQLITNWEAAPAEVAALIHPHPTLSEALGEAMLSLAGKRFHG